MFRRFGKTPGVPGTVLAATLLAASTATAGIEYDMFVIDPWDPSYSLATSALGDINNSNVAVGIAYDSGPLENNFLWEESTGKVRADIGGGEINDAGVTAASTAIYWAPGDYFLVPHPAGGIGVGIRDLNNANVVTGSAPISERTLAFVWDETSGSRYLEDLGVPPTTWRGYALNDAGQLVGSRSLTGEQFDQQAFLIDIHSLEYTDLHALLNPGGNGKTVPHDITESGVVVGEGSYDDGAGIAGWTWSAADGFTLLPGLNGGLEMDLHPESINEDGVVVGRAIDGSGEWRAFRWDPLGGMVDLETLVDVPAGFNVEEATAINDNGWILGRGFWSQVWGPSRAFVLVPRSGPSVATPEPLAGPGIALTVPSPVRSGSARIELTLPVAARVDLSVFDVNGRRVARLVPGRPLAAGHHVREWSGAGAASSGVYFVRMEAGERREVRKLVRVR